MIILDFFKWIDYLAFSPLSGGYYWLGVPGKRAASSGLHYNRKICPTCKKEFYDYAGHKVCYRFKCFRSENAK